MLKSISKQFNFQSLFLSSKKFEPLIIHQQKQRFLLKKTLFLLCFCYLPKNFPQYCPQIKSVFFSPSLCRRVSLYNEKPSEQRSDGFFLYLKPITCRAIIRHIRLSYVQTSETSHYGYVGNNVDSILTIRDLIAFLTNRFIQTQASRAFCV